MNDLHSPPADRTSYVVEDALSRPFRAVSAWYRALLPAHVPDAVRRMFFMSTLGVLPLLSLLIGAVFDYSWTGNLQNTLAELSSGGGAYVLAPGLAALLLCHAIPAERFRTQIAAGCVLVVAAAVALLHSVIGNAGEEVSRGVALVVAAAVATFQCLFRDAAARAYYRRLRTEAGGSDPQIL